MTHDPRELIRQAEARFAAAGIGSPRTDAELLLAEVLGVARAGLLTAGPLTPTETAAFGEFVQRRAAREPLQHIVGHAPFRYLELAVGPGVFIPRPETELLVDIALKVIRPGDTVVDLCAGSGAIGLSVLTECPGASVIAVERDADALTWLRRNAEGTGLVVVEGDVRDSDLLVDRHGLADVVLSNPPYVPRATRVEPEVLADPDVAVFAGPDGAELLPAVVARAAELLRPGGLLAFEHDDSHAGMAPRLLASDGRWREITSHCDLAGRPRFTAALRAGTDRADD